MLIKRLDGDPAEAMGFSWNRLLAKPGNRKPALLQPAVLLLCLLLAASIAGYGALLPGEEPRLPPAAALTSNAPEVDFQLLRLHENLLRRDDEESLRLRLLCHHWLVQRSQF